MILFLKFTFIMQEPDIGGKLKGSPYSHIEKKDGHCWLLEGAPLSLKGRLRNKVEQEPANIDRLLSSPLIGAARP